MTQQPQQKEEGCLSFACGALMLLSLAFAMGFSGYQLAKDWDRLAARVVELERRLDAIEGKEKP